MIESIIRKVVPDGQVVRSWPLKGGIVAEMTAVEVKDGNGKIRKLVVRQHETAVYEYRVLQLTAALGLKTAEPYYLHESADGPVLVTSFIEGGLDFGTGDVAGYVRQMAEALATVHTADLSGIEHAFLERRSGRCNEVGRLESYLGTDGRLMKLDVGRMEAVLARGMPGQENPSRLLHGDFWAGNMLWRQGNLVGVIDWEDANLGDPLQDLAAARVELVWLFGVEVVDLFLDTYQQHNRIDMANLAYWDLCAVLRLLRLVKGSWQWLVDFVEGYGRGDITAEIIGSAYEIFVNRALARLDASQQAPGLGG